VLIVMNVSQVTVLGISVRDPAKIKSVRVMEIAYLACIVIFLHLLQKENV